MHFWNRWNHSIRNQVILRVMPLVALGALLTVAVGGMAILRVSVADHTGANEEWLEQAVDLALVKVVNAALGGGSVSSDPTGISQDDLDHWLEDHHTYAVPDYRPATWSGVRDEAEPFPAHASPHLSVLVFPPTVASEKSSPAWFPVVVHTLAGPGPTTRVLALPVDDVLPDPGPGRRLFLQDEEGRLLFASGEGRSAVPAREPVPRGWPLPALVQHQTAASLGTRWTLVDPLIQVNRTAGIFLALGTLLGLLTFMGVWYNIHAVVGRASNQMNDLAGNMEALAAGDYSGRMPQPEKNEVGHLIGYFNLMAVSLDEAHRQVNDKAAHLRVALENMRMLDKAKDNFLVLISHEVRTPLTAIMGGVEFLRKSVEQVEGPEREVLDRLNINEITGIIQSSGERLSGFMNDAIQMTTLGSSESLLRLQPVPLRELLAESLNRMAGMARKKDVTIQNQLGDADDFTLLCDPAVLQAALGKILVNAIQHNRPGGVVFLREAVAVPGVGPISALVTREGLQRLEDQPSFGAYEDEELGWKLLEVFNTGVPIPEDRREALFGKFEVVGPIENHQKGTGLSLPIAQAACESHGGGIYLHCDPADGNTFFLLLPVIKVMPGSRVAERLSEALTGNKQGKSLVRTAWDEDVSELADATPFEVELDDQCASILGCIDEAGSGVDGSSRADHEEELAVARRLE